MPPVALPIAQKDAGDHLTHSKGPGVDPSPPVPFAQGKGLLDQENCLPGPHDHSPHSRYPNTRIPCSNVTETYFRAFLDSRPGPSSRAGSAASALTRSEAVAALGGVDRTRTWAGVFTWVHVRMLVIEEEPRTGREAKM